ncbi:MAG: hypothetical protein NZ869_05255 [Thermoanaerobaculum sp.]|nr:hypothetical protein [Thermoanaerobaculum sp.]MDW7968148.1 hypothetical protein [Thermoanaerobaculum sp.]
MRAFRLVWGVLALFPGAVGAQTFFAGGGIGAVWERHAPVAPAKEWFHTTEAGESFFVAVAIDDETLLRVERTDLPRDVMVRGTRWEARLAAWAVGVDYLLPGVFGQAVVAAGVGSYRLDLAARIPPPGVEDSRFGWYLRVGERFRLSRRFFLAAEVSYHRTSHPGSPQLLAAFGSLVASF